MENLPYFMGAALLILSVTFFALLISPKAKQERFINDYELVNRYLIFQRKKDLDEIKKRNIEYFLRQKEMEGRIDNKNHIV